MLYLSFLNAFPSKDSGCIVAKSSFHRIALTPFSKKMKSSRSKKKRNIVFLLIRITNVAKRFDFSPRIQLGFQWTVIARLNGRSGARAVRASRWKIQTLRLRFALRVGSASTENRRNILTPFWRNLEEVESSRRGKRRAGLFERIGSVKSSKRREKLYCSEWKNNFLNFEKRRYRVGQRDVINDWKLINNRWSLITFLI